MAKGTKSHSNPAAFNVIELGMALLNRKTWRRDSFTMPTIDVKRGKTYHVETRKDYLTKHPTGLNKNHWPRVFKIYWIQQYNKLQLLEASPILFQM